MIFTNEESIGRNRDTLYPSPIHEIASSPESSPVPLKKIPQKSSLPYRKRGIFILKMVIYMTLYADYA